MNLKEIIKDRRRMEKITKSLPKNIPTKKDIEIRDNRISKFAKKLSKDVEKELKKQLFKNPRLNESI